MDAIREGLAQKGVDKQWKSIDLQRFAMEEPSKATESHRED